eukprot:366083-Chlamydomonas_euryale.AAC.11
MARVHWLGGSVTVRMCGCPRDKAHQGESRGRPPAASVLTDVHSPRASLRMSPSHGCPRGNPLAAGVFAGVL